MTFHNMWLHTNINVGYGPLKYFLVSPNYHKWHHATARNASNKNFADIFPVLDILGGSFYLPKNQQPQEFGLWDEPRSSQAHQSYLGILVYPIIRIFKTKKSKN